MIKTTKTCDRCPASGDEQFELFRVTVGIKHNGTMNYLQDTAKRGQDWCRVCCIEMGVFPPLQRVDATPIVPEPTLEEMIKLIIREEIKT